MKIKILILLFLSTPAMLFAGPTLVDRKQGLMWQAKPVYKNWNQAGKYCQNLSLGGFTNWRVPNKGELVSVYKRNNIFKKRS